MAYSMMNTGLKLCLMASYRVEKTWSDLQESLNRVRQQLGFVSRAGWDDLVARDAPSRVHSTPQHNRQKVHSPSHLPRKGTLRKSVICSSQQPASQPEYSDIRDSAMILCSGRLLPNSASVRQQDHGGNEKRPSGTRSHSPGLQREFAACSFFRENKSFAWNFLDLFILEVLRDELVPDILMEVMSDSSTKHPLYLPTEKNFYSKSHLQQIVKLDVLKQQPAVSVLDTLLEEIVSELTLGLIRTVVEELVSNHLTTAAITESLTEVMAETIEPMVAQLVKEAVSEALLEEILQEEMLTEVVDEEMRNVAMLLLTDYDTEIYEQQQQAVRTYASKRLIDMFLLEKLVKIIGSQGRAFSEKIEMDRLLDSWMLDVLLGQYLNITKHNNLTVENVALRDYHTKAFTNVVLDVILMEMSEYMDEDLADLFQYERQMEQTNLIVD
ncbi:uncharacterized protein LOC119954351 isoform X2 [Scyliorhinus canicula]|uniref:uncharacterized protein LOC119954351 isoform X2 n=1 Tax=Scyliorhinus canicula TaxID=7830 RepID=UPI0018F4A33A|nr:uncharacterized protein LOC119954351 isoform X2 [Scyliorhinus canicula]